MVSRGLCLAADYEPQQGVSLLQVVRLYLLSSSVDSLLSNKMVCLAAFLKAGHTRGVLTGLPSSTHLPIVCY